MGEVLANAEMQVLHSFHRLIATVYNHQAKSLMGFRLQMVASLCRPKAWVYKECQVTSVSLLPLCLELYFYISCGVVM